MVINGEKTPAFSARTLNLPLAQTDNTKHIIENTRHLYSRPRAEVEAEISNLMQPRGGASNAPVAKPVEPAGTTWPINAQSQVVTPDTAGDTPAPAKKKRTRSRKKKSSSPATNQEGQQQQTSQPANNETIVKLR